MWVEMQVCEYEPRLQEASCVSTFPLARLSCLEGNVSWLIHRRKEDERRAEQATQPRPA